ncbi:MAG: Rieske 2Fe-2S domain-containing protein [Chloroflexi bacterium]|nr:Rieske 2Fe-2S domain-containing protein [Chloroflexota bacterium]MBV9544332.1 Rieske 2Fe-2S domain-containing protein [Chloroflexota bacterium]
MSTLAAERVSVGSVSEVRERGCTVVAAGGHGVAVFSHDGRFYAVDNRCPHMGFPLSRGTVRDGLLTCHWHHARFDLEGGGTLDPFADNVRTFRVEVDDDRVYLVLDEPSSQDREAHWLARLEEGLEHQLEFVLAKASIALQGGGTPASDVVRTIGRYGLRYRGRGWNMGMTILTALGRLLPVLAPEDRPLALLHGAVRVADDTAGGPPRFDLEPLPSTSVPSARLKEWFRRAVEVRDEDGAERILQTAIARGVQPAVLADMLFAAATDHVYLDAGHVLDFINKACEYLDLVGWSEASATLPSVVGGLCRAQRSEEQNAWRNPIDLIDILATHLDGLGRMEMGTLPLGDEFDRLVSAVLQDEPAAGVQAITAALERGVAPAETGRAVAHASVLRIGRFHTSNEFADWDSVHNTWTSCQALAQALRRAPSRDLARGLYHAAMRVYLDRFLNVPAARLPDERPHAGNGRAASMELLDLMDREQQVAAVAEAVDALVGARESGRVVSVLGHAVLREDSDFHGYQTLEAGVQQFNMLREDHPLAARRTLVSISRYLAAHAPTPRALHQTYQIAVRLMRGDDLTIATDDS